MTLGSQMHEHFEHLLTASKKLEESFGMMWLGVRCMREALLEFEHNFAIGTASSSAPRQPSQPGERERSRSSNRRGKREARAYRPIAQSDLPTRVPGSARRPENPTLPPPLLSPTTF